MAYDWTDLIDPGLRLGGSIIGNTINAGPAKASVKENARQFDITKQRSDQARQMLMPTLRTNLGYGAGGPQMGMSSYQAYGAPQGGGGGGLGGALKKVAGVGGAAMSIPGVAGLAAKGAGALGGLLTGGGAATKIGLGGYSATGAGGGIGGALGALATNPITWAVGGGLLGAKLLSKIGAGRKQADKLTQPGGIQAQLNTQLAQLEQQHLPPEQFDAIATKLYDRAMQQGRQFAQKGKNQAKVVNQMAGSYNWSPALSAASQKYLGAA